MNNKLLRFFLLFQAQMLRKPIRSRRNHKSAVSAPLASPEHDGMFYSKWEQLCLWSDKRNFRFDIGRNIGRRIDKSLGRFGRRHSLGREKKKSPVSKDSHSAVEYEHSNTSNEI